MSDQITLTVDERKTIGKGVKQLRGQGIVPGVVHDHGKPSVHIQGDFRELTKVYSAAGKHHPVQLTAGSKKFTALIKSATFDPRKNMLTHIVFGAVKANEKVDAEVPIRAAYAEGNEASPAERAGLIVLEQLTAVEVKALPKDLPDELTYDAEKLVAVGDQLTVADLRVPTGVVVETNPEHVIVTVFEPSALAAANDEAGGDASPEAEVATEDSDSASGGDTQSAENNPGGQKAA